MCSMEAEVLIVELKFVSLRLYTSLVSTSTFMLYMRIVDPK